MEVELDNIKITCEIRNRTVKILYVTGRKRYTCHKCKKSIKPKEDHYYTVIDTTLVPKDNKNLLGELTVFFARSNLKRRFHTECFSDRSKSLEAKKAREHFRKL